MIPSILFSFSRGSQNRGGPRPARLLFVLSALAVVVLCFLAPTATTQDKAVPKVSPKLEPVAETKLLMEGLALANFRGLERQLATRPTDEQNWVFARGQALLIAETANLLMLRPPKKEGQATWFARAPICGRKPPSWPEPSRPRTGNAAGASSSTLAPPAQCHKSFRVPVVVEPFTEPAPKVE
ncbi:MAG: hypothetical protein U0793_10530 [Gemmataceae bacterium]